MPSVEGLLMSARSPVRGEPLRFAALSLLIACLFCAPLKASGLIERQLTGGETKPKIKLRTTAGKINFTRSYELLTLRDPTCPTASSIRVGAPGQDSGTVNLPCQNWRFTGSGYRYDDPIGSSAGVTKIVWKARKLQVALKGNHYQAIEGPVPHVEARLTVGNETYCGRFTAFSSNQPTSVAGTLTVACAPLPPPTATPTPTPTQPFVFPTIIIFPPTPTPTPKPLVFLLNPFDGAFIDPDGQVALDANGFVTNPLPGSQVFVNGVLVWEQGVSPNQFFSTTVPLDPTKIFQPVLAELHDPNVGFLARDRKVVIYSEKILEGAVVQEAIALRVDGNTLDKLEDHFEDTIVLDVPAMAPAGLDLGPLVSGNDTYVKVAPTISDFTIDMDTKATSVGLVVDLLDFAIELEVDGFVNCGIALDAAKIRVSGTYDLEPSAANPSAVEATQLSIDAEIIGAFSMQVSGFGCPAPSAEDAEFAMAAIEDIVVDKLGDPPGAAEPLIEDKIEEALSGLNLDNVDGLGAALDAPMNSIHEDLFGVTINADGEIFFADFPPPGAPDFPASVHIPGSFPTIPLNTPAGDDPYDIAVGFSLSLLNQLLKIKAESAHFNEIVTTVPVPVSIPLPGGGFIQITLPQKITAGLLANMLADEGLVEAAAAFEQLAPTTPLRVRIKPAIAPIVTGDSGPDGEDATLQASQMSLALDACSGGAANDCETATQFVNLLLGVADFEAGFDFGVAADGGLSITVSPPSSVVGYLLTDNLGVPDAAFSCDNPAACVLANLVAATVPSMASGLGSLPLPSFAEHEAEAIEVDRISQSFLLFMTLEPIP